LDFTQRRGDAKKKDLAILAQWLPWVMLSASSRLCVRLFQSIDHPMDSVLHPRRTKIQEQAQPKISQAKIINANRRRVIGR
jgi:hypothetical protein